MTVHHHDGEPVLPVPDPTVATTNTRIRAAAAERDYVNARFATLEERLKGMDRAADVLSETVNRTPTDIQKEVAHLRDLFDQRFDAVAGQFKERDVRSERESRDNKVAVDAAFAAQKEAAAKQDEANSKAIDKSERATNETIVKNADSATAATKALSDKVDDLKERLSIVESARIGAHDQRLETRQGASATYAFVGIVITVILFAVTVIGFILNIKK